MLEELHLQNFRCFADHRMPFKRSTVIVGANNAGKSTIVEALRLLSLVVSRYENSNFRDVPQWLEKPKYYRGIAPSTNGIDWNTVSIFHNLGRPPAIITARFDSGVAVEIYIGPEAAIHAVVKDCNDSPIATKGQARLAPIPPVSILPQVAPVVKEENILVPEYAKRVISSSWASLHFRNQMNLFPQYFDEFKMLSEDTWPDLRIRPLEGQGGLPGEQLALLIHDGDFVGEIAWMGHGLQMWLQTMWFLARSEKGSTLILDEPDVYMHADLQRKLIRLLKGRYRQIIVATHSVEIMAEMDASEILLVNRKSEKSSFATSVPAVQRVIASLGGIHNLQLARLSTSGKCLLVEGDDLPYLKQVHSMLFSTDAIPLDVIPNTSIGGWGGWSYAIGSQILLKNAIGEEITVYCILDSDYHTPEDIALRQKDAISKGVQLHVWKKKEIENYLIVPEAIQRLIQAKVKAEIVTPTILEINTQINLITDQMKSEVFDSLATEFLAKDKGRGVTEANKRARQKVDEAWQSDEGKRSIVSGKALISELSKWTQSNYSISLSPMTILRETRRNELDPELAQVVRAIDKGNPF